MSQYKMFMRVGESLPPVCGTVKVQYEISSIISEYFWSTHVADVIFYTLQDSRCRWGSYLLSNYNFISKVI